MKAGDSAKRTIVLYDILLKHSDESHRISMPELIAALAEQGIQADRRTVYQSLRALNESHHPVRYSRFEKAGYYAEHPFTAAQAMILTDQERMTLTPTYHVFEMYTVHHDATWLPTDLQCGNYQAGEDKIPALNVSASRDKAGQIHVTLCHLNPTAAAEVTGVPS